MATDHFEVLGLEPRFDLSEAEIERAYLARVASTHPDLAGADSARDAACLNDARLVLRDPERRARALLELLEAGASADREALPEGFLLEIMEVRMGLEEAVSTGNSAEIARWRAWAGQERQGYLARLAGLFADAASDPSCLSEVREQLNAWRYVERMLEQLPEE